MLLEEIVRTSALLSRQTGIGTLIATLAEQTLDITGSDLSAVYVYANQESARSRLVLAFKRGPYDISSEIKATSDLAVFAEDCSEAMVLLRKRATPLNEILLHESMASGMALPLRTKDARIGILFVNARAENHYNSERFHFLESTAGVASGILQNLKLYDDLKKHVKRIESLERYQESIFASMTNLLVTADSKGSVHYFNQAAMDRLGLRKEDLGKNLREVLVRGMTKDAVAMVNSTASLGGELLGFEGIYEGESDEMDFSLNITPLAGKRGKMEGTTLLFTDQTRERELKDKVSVVSEERRTVKDMFARYLSKDMVANLLKSPHAVRPGGDKKQATVFFADIRGYTAFSEGRDPEYIIRVLNDYYSEAVEIVVKHRGYIDKFIGDCIMAAWGVPVQSEEDDAVQAVSCALEIQERVASKDRSFFRKEASHLSVGIGMHTGSLVAGNIGSRRRMDYSMIGDTVNVAARLEGVAGPGEIIITLATRELLGDEFKIRALKPVQVKGKRKPIQVYKVST